MNKPAPSSYRPCVGIALFNDAGKVFVGERIDTLGAWQMPQGGVDDGEDIKVAALRELTEETGITRDHVDIIRTAPEELYYDLPAELQKTFWNGSFKGQRQTWIAMRFRGVDSDINLNAHNSPEFSQWKWADLKDTPNMIVPFKKDIYRQLIKLFGDLANSQ